jgi:hypothetical protein
MVAGASRLGETSGTASDGRLHLEEVPAFCMSSPECCLPKQSEIVGMSSGTTSGVQGIRGLDPGVARGR